MFTNSDSVSFLPKGLIKYSTPASSSNLSGKLFLLPNGTVVINALIKAPQYSDVF